MRDIFADRAAEVSLFEDFISRLGEIIYNPGAFAHCPRGLERGKSRRLLVTYAQA
jgi:hypothetical protein